MGKKIDYSATEKAQLTSEGKDSDLSRLQANGARALPSSPSASGWSADAIKRQLYRPAELLFAWLVKLARAQLDLAQKADDALDGETARLDQNVASLSSLISTKEQSLLAKITQEATTRGNADAALSARIDEAKANGYAKFDDLGNVIKDTYVKRTQIVNNVTSEGETEKPLGAGQGYVLQNQIDHILTLLASDDSTLDTLQEVVAYIKSNKSLIDAITTTKVSVSDIIDNLTSEVANKPLSAKQGKVLKGLIDALQTVVNTLATKSELEEVKDELDSASVDVLDYSMGKVSGTDDGLALPEESQLELEGLRGNTVAWNQLLPNGNFASDDGWTATNVSFSVSNNIATFTATAQSGSLGHAGVSFVQGHKYLLSASIKTTTNTTDIWLRSQGENRVRTSDTTNWQTLFVIYTSAYTQPNNSCVVRDERASDWDVVQVRNYVCIDLTQLYGAGNEPTVFIDPKAQWAINYALKHPAYDAGSLVSVDMSAYETEGFNQWDEEWEVGIYNTSTGAKASGSSDRIRSKNLIKTKPNTTYYFKTPINPVVLCYDANGTFIPTSEYSWLYAPNLNANSNFTTPQNCAFIAFYVNSSSYGTIYKHDICINVSDPSLNGTYKPYEKNPYPISFHGKSAGSAYDERKADGTDIVRIGSVDLGTLNWVSQTGGFYAPLSGVKTPSSNDVSANIKTPLYTTTSVANWSLKSDMSIGLSTGGNVNIKNANATSVSELTELLSGQYLYFELATPVQSVNDPLPNAIKVYQDGTEWQINDGAPCGMEKDYDVSIKAQVITNVHVDARQEEEIKELKETAMTAENVEGVKLWENGDTNSSFGPQALDLRDLSAYRYLDVVYRGNTGSGKGECVYRYINRDGNENPVVMIGVDSNNNVYYKSRTFTISGATITFASAFEKVNNEKPGVRNSICIPIAIYGIK